MSLHEHECVFCKSAMCEVTVVGDVTPMECTGKPLQAKGVSLDKECFLLGGFANPFFGFFSCLSNQCSLHQSPAKELNEASAVVTVT